MIGGFVLLVGVSFLLATRDRVPSTPQVQLVSHRVKQVPRSDLASPLWEAAPALEAVLIPQAATHPFNMNVVVPTVSVRSLNDGRWIAFLLEWEDAAPDWSAGKVREFADQAAIQFPVADAMPSVCMGSAGQLANLWLWRADWQWDIDNGFRDVTDLYPNFYIDQYPAVNMTNAEPPFRYPEDFASPDAQLYSPGLRAGNPRAEAYRTSPVEDAIAEGFGTLTTRAVQPVNGVGEWKDGRWRVIFTRPLETGDVNARQFQPGSSTQASFAVWDGAFENRGSRKQLSPFYTVLVEDVG